MSLTSTSAAVVGRPLGVRLGQPASPDAPMWCFLPAVWPYRDRAWVRDRATRGHDGGLRRTAKPAAAVGGPGLRRCRAGHKPAPDGMRAIPSTGRPAVVATAAAGFCHDARCRGVHAGRSSRRGPTDHGLEGPRSTRHQPPRPTRLTRGPSRRTDVPRDAFRSARSNLDSTTRSRRTQWRPHARDGDARTGSTPRDGTVAGQRSASGRCQPAESAGEIRSFRVDGLGSPKTSSPLRVQRSRPLAWALAAINRSADRRDAGDRGAGDCLDGC